LPVEPRSSCVCPERLPAHSGAFPALRNGRRKDKLALSNLIKFLFWGDVMKKGLVLIAGAWLAFVANCSNASAQNYQALRAEYAQLSAQAQRCEAQMTAQNARQLQAAINGVLLPPAPCSAYMGSWASRLYFLENQMKRMETGDYTSSPCRLNPSLIGCDNEDD